MILPDVNVLVYALREDTEDHEQYRDWLEAVLNGPSRFAISQQVLSGVVRIATHPRINRVPSRPDDVFEFLDQVRDAPGCVEVQPGPRHWGLFEGLCRKLKLAGNLVPDAWFAALAIEGGLEWITADRGFGRFPGLRWRHPLDG